jgi:hypothetical protein
VCTRHMIWGAELASISRDCLAPVYQFPRLVQSIGVQRRHDGSIRIVLLAIDFFCDSMTSGVMQSEF